MKIDEKRFCHKPVEGLKCLLFKGHAGQHSKRQGPREPPQDKLLQILELAASKEVGHLWSWIWTYSSGGWITWMVDRGLLSEELRDGYDYTYGGFSWSGMAPINRITEKGSALLAYHAPVEW